ncbi:MAG: ABC transporter ATP-binding protein [Candidatus Bipolaricaulota bacterium]|nr:ABC transporter ATP-binding protein [Candidatus Bipolaricaulota bacterium]MBS3792660.1 ABC transporter ATP-binding protein [Candidatus Bipolaricaulota bacterium]
MKKITLSGVSKFLGSEKVIRDVNLEVESGEFFVIIGPTGCGKTTFLKLVAGLLSPDNGEICFDEEVVNNLTPSERKVRMIFEDHALYPHLKVHSEEGYSNLNFPLKMMKLGLKKIGKRIIKIIDRLGISEKLFNRKPGELSEGQKQQVALGRALTIPPEVLLFDEPLRDMDPQTRNEARSEILKAHQDFSSTSIYVTHDLAEGFSLGERVAIMKDGKFIQTGSPEEILSSPKNSFVESFVESYRETYREAFDT